MSKEKRKLHLFRRYRRNIELLCENPQYNRDVLKDIVICPICMTAFNESDVKKSNSKNFLTIEHVPPQYMGGRTEVLTCYKCNNLFSEFDKELLYGPHRPGSDIVAWRTKLKSDEGRFGALAKFDLKKDELSFTLGSSDDLSSFINSLKSNNEFNLEIKDKTRAVGTNLMKMAYLLAFHKFGYGLILKPQYNYIREQLKNPYKAVLDNHGIVHLSQDANLPDGVFIVKEPKDFVSLLIRFRLIDKNETVASCSVHLPSPAVDVVDFYKRLGNITKDTKFVVADFNNLDYWHDSTLIYAAIIEMEQYSR